MREWFQLSVSSHKSQFRQLLNSEQNDAECDATADAQRTERWQKINKNKTFITLL
jgi:hypothetical protein